jgi:hypothetical protein
MEFPILEELSLPLTAIRIVTEFLREPHPTAAMIKDVLFQQYEWGSLVSGKTVRCHVGNRHPPKYMKVSAKIVCMLKFVFDPYTGEFCMDNLPDNLDFQGLLNMGFDLADLVDFGIDPSMLTRAIEHASGSGEPAIQYLLVSEFDLDGMRGILEWGRQQALVPQ